MKCHSWEIGLLWLFLNIPQTQGKTLAESDPTDFNSPKLAVPNFFILDKEKREYVEKTQERLEQWEALFYRIKKESKNSTSVQRKENLAEMAEDLRLRMGEAESYLRNLKMADSDSWKIHRSYIEASFQEMSYGQSKLLAD